MKTLTQYINLVETNDRAFSHLDRFVIINTVTNKKVQGETTQDRADANCKVLNDHENRNGREPIYQVRLLPRISTSDF